MTFDPRTSCPKATVALVTTDDLYYAVAVSVGTPRQPLHLSIVFRWLVAIEVSAYALPRYSRGHFNESNSTSFVALQSMTDATMGSDMLEFAAAGGGSYSVTLQADEADRAKQLFDQQPFDGWFGLDILAGPIGFPECPPVLRYAFDLRRRCANGRLEDAAGTMAYGTLDGAGCAGDFISLPVSEVDECSLTNFQVTKISAGGEESSPPFSTSVALALKEDIYLPPPLFKPIAVAYNVSKASHGRYSVQCNRTYPPVTVTVAASRSLVLDYWNLVYFKDGQCYLRVTDQSDLDDPGCDMFYIGIPLFHQYCVTFDYKGDTRNFLKVRAKKNLISDPSRICDYTSPATTSTTVTSTASTTTTSTASTSAPADKQASKGSGPALAPSSGLPTGLIVGLCIACLVVLCFLAAAGFAVYFYRRKILHAHFLLAFSESRHRNKTLVASKSADTPTVVDEWVISSNDLETTLCVLGHGHFSTVFKGSLKLKGSQAIEAAPMEPIVVAVKIANEGPNTASEDIWREIQRHKELRSHTHVVTMLGYLTTNAKRPILVFEYCSKGDARKWLQENRRLSEDNAFDWTGYVRQQMSIAWQVSDGMAYVSAMNIIHRDIAARNVLLAEGFVAKVADFGLARSSDDNIYPSKNFGRLPVKRMAPESLKHGTFSTKSDVWAFGLLLYEIFSSGEEPFDDIEPDALLAALEEGLRPPQPTRCPAEVHDVMQNCFAANPELRPMFDELRAQLATFLDKSAVHYGYLCFGAHEAPDP